MMHNSGKINTLYLIIGALIILAVGLVMWHATASDAVNTETGEEVSANRELAQCLDERGATFYGAFWCPHCERQKEMFGSAAEELPYVECSPPDRNGQTQACEEANIKSYPTWEFADGSRQSGVMTQADLAERTGCPTP